MKSDNKRVIYILGPMRGYENYNFPAFDAARDRAKSLGFDEVISPADMDRVDEKDLSDMPMFDRQKIYARRDVDAIMRCTHVAALPGWEKSTGAKAEYCLAKWIGLTVLDATTFEPLEGNYCFTREEEVVNA